ncbi:retrovirus-related pol polyprotein from transposon TNT 1-94 [Tanacetum coccineum]
MPSANWSQNIGANSHVKLIWKRLDNSEAYYGGRTQFIVGNGPYTPTIVTTPAIPATEDSPVVPEQTTVWDVTNMTPENRAHFESEKEAIHLILTGIEDEIYSTVDACQTAQEMWEAIERLQQIVTTSILFLVDSRNPKHNEGNIYLLCNVVDKYLGTVRFGNDQFAPMIKRVYYVEGLNHNLFLVGQFCDADLEDSLSTLPKDETPEDLKEFLKMIQRNSSSPGKFCSHLDRAQSSKQRHSMRSLKNGGIEHQTSTPRTPEHNDVVERKNRTLVEEAMADSAWLDKHCRTSDPPIPTQLVINQAKYTFENLKKHGMEKGQSIGTPMTTKPKLDADLSGEPVDQTDYRSKIGSLMYLTSSRPDIVQAVCYCARYQARPTEKHLKEVKRIFRYLRGTIHMGLWYPKGSGFDLTAFSDADHAGCLDTRKSTSGGIQFLGDKLVSWMSKKQDCTAMSSAEAEYVALSASCAQVMWMRTQLQDYGFNYNKIPLYCDSQSAIAISCNPVQHSRTKHIHTRYHFIKEQVENGIIELYFVRTEYQLADMFTKALPEERFQYLVRRIGMRCLTPAELEVLTKESA